MSLSVGVGQNVSGFVKYCSELKSYKRNAQDKPYFNFHVVTGEGALIRGVSFIARFHDQIKNSTSVKLENVEIKNSKFYAGQLEIVIQEQTVVNEIPEEDLSGKFLFTKIKDVPTLPMTNVRGIIINQPSSSSVETKTGTVTLHKTTIRDETGTIPLVKWGGCLEAKVGDAAEIMHASPTKYQNQLQLTLSSQSSVQINPSGKEVDQLNTWYTQLSEDDEAPLDVSTMDVQQHFCDQTVVDEIEQELHLLERKKKRLMMELSYHKSLPSKYQKLE